MITANQAKQKANKSTSGNMGKLSLLIEEKANNGGHNIIVTFSLNSNDIKQLEALGYTVVHTCDDRPCASPYYNISW